jgi:hypothetical protein
VKIQITIHLPLWKEAGVAGHLSKIVEMDGIPRKGDSIGVPVNRNYDVDFVQFRDDRHVSVHVGLPSQILAQTTDEGAGVTGVQDLAEDLRLAGYREITEWDNEEEADGPDPTGVTFDPERLQLLTPRVDQWMGLTIGDERVPTWLADQLTDVFLHLDRIDGYDVNPSRATFESAGRILKLLEWAEIAPNDFVGAKHLGAIIAILAGEDQEVVVAEALRHWHAERDGTDALAEALTPAMFIGGVGS